MPNRILKESVCTSPTLEQLSWFEEVCFYRLLVQCDDYGRLDARPVLLRAWLFPLREDIDSETVAEAIAALERVGLIRRYTVEGVPFLQLCTWEKHQRVRNRRSRYPAPDGSYTAPDKADDDDDDSLPQVAANGRKLSA